MLWWRCRHLHCNDVVTTSLRHCVLLEFGALVRISSCTNILFTILMFILTMSLCQVSFRASYAYQVSYPLQLWNPSKNVTLVHWVIPTQKWKIRKMKQPLLQPPHTTQVQVPRHTSISGKARQAAWPACPQRRLRRTSITRYYSTIQLLVFLVVKICILNLEHFLQSFGEKIHFLNYAYKYKFWCKYTLKWCIFFLYA